MTKISFVVAIYNVAKYLVPCIESLVGQSYKNIEIILVNDGSDDECLNICRVYEKEFSNIKVINQPNQGANVARNKGLEIATGEWILFVDGDDFVECDLCLSLLQYLNPKYDIIMFSNYFVYGDKKIACTHQFATWEIKGEDFKELCYSTLNRIGNYKYNIKMVDPVTIWNKAYRADFLKANNLKFVPKFPKLQDISFNLMVYEKAKQAMFVDYPGYCYREATETSVTRRYQEDIDKKFEVINAWFQNYLEKNTDEKLRKAYYERIVTHLRTCIVLKYCNRNYKKPYKMRREEFFHIMEDEIYKEAIKKCDCKNFPWKEKILSNCIKRKCFLLCEILVFMQQKIRK